MSGFASISGTEADEFLSPDYNSQFNIISGLGGNDVIDGMAGDDVLFGGSGNDLVLGGSGEDWMFGEAGADTLIGGAGEDLMLGGAGRDVLFGGLGGDLLIGGGGDDKQDGGLGADVFEFDNNFGADVITNFNLGVDSLHIASNINGTGISGPGDLVGLISADANGNAVITLGGDTITLDGVTSANLIANLNAAVTVF